MRAEEFLKEDKSKIYNGWCYTTAEEGASNYWELEKKGMTLDQAKAWLQATVADDSDRDGSDYDFQVTVEKPKVKANYDGAVTISQTIDFHEDEFAGYAGTHDFRHTWMIAPSYHDPRKK